MIKGLQQCIPYNSAYGRIEYTVRDENGRPVVPTSAPTCIIYDPSGTQLVASAAMTVCSDTTAGWLDYDGQTQGNEFGIGETLTGGTSAATATIVDLKVSGTTGSLLLANIDGTFANNEAITDSGTGSALANLVLYQTRYYKTVDTTTTASWPVGQNYYAVVTQVYASVTRTYQVIFDVALYPADKPWVTTADIVERFPHLTGQLPREWPDWTPAIHEAHRDLVRRIHALGEKAAYFVRRDQELWNVEMLFTRAEIARALGEPKDVREYWERAALDAWQAKGELTMDDDDDDEVDDDTPKILGGGFSR